VISDRECGCDVAVGQAVRDEREHVVLARRQMFDRSLVIQDQPGKRDHSVSQLDAIDECQSCIGHQPCTQRVELSRRPATQKHL
jgi:hypothetical protein